MTGSGICSVSGCGKSGDVSRGKGMCAMHYWRWRKYGSLDAPAPKPSSKIEVPCGICAKPILVYPRTLARNKGTYCSSECRVASYCQPVEQRFWRYVVKGDDCWEWQGATRSGGYGRFDGTGAHRISWLIHFGTIPDGLYVCHRCDNPPCVRPDHLFLGEASHNSADMVAKGRQAKGDRSGFHVHPEARLKISGDKNPSRRHPERLARGDQHGSRTKPERIPRGERHAKTTVTTDQVIEMRRLYDEGMSIAAIARNFGMSHSGAYGIVHRLTWTHVN